MAYETMKTEPKKESTTTLRFQQSARKKRISKATVAPGKGYSYESIKTA